MRATATHESGREWADRPFPQANRWLNRVSKEEGRHHVDASLVQKAVREAVVTVGLTKRATCHGLRHSFATLLLGDGYDVRTLQELLGHGDVRTTMMDTHVLNRGLAGLRSPVDALLGEACEADPCIVLP